MAARASCTDGAAARCTQRRLSWPRCALGIAWGHASLVALALAAPALTQGWGGPAGRLAARLIAWSALAPASLTVAFVTHTAEPFSALARTGLPSYALPLPALLGAAGTWCWCAVTRTGGARRRLARVLLACGLVAAVLAGAVLLDAAVKERRGEKLFMSMVAGDDPPWQLPAARARARELATRYPQTRWASEAWRVLALDAERRGSQEDAAQAWRSFEECFADEDLPGRALAALGIARALDGQVPSDETAAHYLAARHRIARAAPDTQSWIAVQAANELARLARQGSLYATASYWESRASLCDEHRPNRDGG